MGRSGNKRLNGVLALLNVHQSARLFFALLLDRRIPWLLKLYAWAGIVYIFSPLDVIPDFFTGIALLDDIILALIIIQAFMEAAPPGIVEEHCYRLNINPQRIFIDIPETVRQAIELYEWAIGPRYRGQTFQSSPGVAASPDQQPPPPDEPASAPPYRRYSAYQEENP